MKQPPAPSPAYVFALNKPAGPTSFDVVHAVKKLLGKGARKIGHFGTLDPFADGLILVGTGGATKLADRFHQEFPKTYRAVGKLGIQMDTGDNTGDILKKSEIKTFDLAYWQAKAKTFEGEYLQKPPAFSATKHEGKALYEYARRGIVIDKEAVKRFIHSISVISVDGDQVVFEATVSSGTYIRTLFEDLASASENVGHLVNLTRTRIGDLCLPQAHGELKEWSQQTLESHWLPFDELLPNPLVTLDGRDLELFGHGQCLTRDAFKELPEEVWVAEPSGQVMALGKVENGVLRSGIMFPGGAPSRIVDKTYKLKLSH
tara:strand:+ start:281 stop:1231 length:951 start_codon:yes stop_codon:yes gene_type:complete